MGKKQPTSSSKLLRIGEAAKAAGVTRQTVEYYILLGLLEPIRPEGGRQRFFDANLIKRIKLIRQLNDSGYTLRDIRETYLRGR